MKRIHKILAGAAGALALLGVTAVIAAPSGGCDGMSRMGMHAGMRGLDPAAMAQRHLKGLKADLKITAQQEPAWQAFSAKVAERAQAMKAKMTERQQSAGAPLAAPDRMAQHIDDMNQRLASMQTMQAALKDLYAVLTPEQKAIADEHAQRMGGPGARRGHGMGPQG
jgi:periplasmic protein CpxP/Spy